MDPLFTSSALEQWCRLLSNPKAIVIATHVNPDGDAIGATTGLTDVLKRYGHKVTLLVPTALPTFLHFLDPQTEILNYALHKEEAQLAAQQAQLLICVDLNGFSRMNSLGAFLKTLHLPSILMDHHPAPAAEDFQLVLSTTEISSASELCARWCAQWHPCDAFSPRQATSFLAGIITDTNQFSNSVNASTFRTAAQLMEWGAQLDSIIAHVFGTYSFNRMHLKGYALEKMKIVPEYKVGYIILTQEELQRYGFQEGDSEGFVNMPMEVDGIQISALFMEKEEHVKVSLRSRGDICVNEMAKRVYHGGGHFNAAAGKSYLPIKQVEAEFLNAVELYFGKA